MSLRSALPAAIPRALRLSIASLLVTSACIRFSSAPSEDVPDNVPTVLFIGNSLTYVNNVPGLVGAIAGQRNQTVYTASVALPDYSLEDHWNDGSAQRLVRSTRWNHVVLQQGPSTLPENRALLATYSRRFDSLVRVAGGVSVMYQVWPTEGRPGDFPASLESYRHAASVVQGMLAPVGDAWSRALAQRPTIGLYDPDGLHASWRGSYLAALVISGRIFEFDPTTLPAFLPGLPADTVTFRFLQGVARDALAASPARP